MIKKKRRTLHQVFCDEGTMPKDHQFIWHIGVTLRKVYENHYNVSYEPVTDKSWSSINLDCDFLAENCREVFPEELITLEVLFGKENS